MLWAGWRQYHSFFTTQNVFRTAATINRRELDVLDIKLDIYHEFTPSEFDGRILEQVEASRISVVVVLAYGADLKTIGVLASRRGLISRGWVWIDGGGSLPGAERIVPPSSSSGARHISCGIFVMAS